MSKQIRLYQKNAIDAVEKALQRNVVNQLLVMATGTGKTFTAVKAIQNKGRVLWGTHTEELIEQSSIALLAELDLMPYLDLVHVIDTHGGIIDLISNAQRGGFFADPKTKLISDKIGIIKADVFEIEKPFVMASMQTLWRRLDRIPRDHFGVVVVDEAHYSGANTWIKSLTHFTPQLRLGLTATPHRVDGMMMGDIFDEIVYEYNIQEAIADGHLCKLNGIQIKTSVDLDGVHTMAGEFNQKELVETVNTLARNNLIANKYLEYAEGRQFIAFCVDVQHAQDLCEAFQEKGIKCDFIVGDKELTTDRKGLINSFKKGELTGLMNVGVLVAGFDHRNVGCTISAAPTKSLVKYLQGPVGRGTRLKDESFVSKFGQNCIILDVVDNTSKHKLINTFTLDKDLPIEKKVFISDENRLKLFDVKAKREAQFTTVQRLQDIKIDLLQLPKVVISDSMRMNEPATEKQLQWIASLGYDVVNVHYTKKHCSEIIATQSASDKQIALLKYKGYDVSNGVTITEAKMAFDQIREKEQAAESSKTTGKFNLPFGL